RDVSLLESRALRARVPPPGRHRHSAQRAAGAARAPGIRRGADRGDERRAESGRSERRATRASSGAASVARRRGLALAPIRSAIDRRYSSGGAGVTVSVEPKTVTPAPLTTRVSNP